MPIVLALDRDRRIRCSRVHGQPGLWNPVTKQKSKTTGVKLKLYSKERKADRIQTMGH